MKTRGRIVDGAGAKVKLVPLAHPDVEYAETADRTGTWAIAGIELQHLPLRLFVNGEEQADVINQVERESGDAM